MNEIWYMILDVKNDLGSRAMFSYVEQLNSQLAVGRRDVETHVHISKDANPDCVLNFENKCVMSHEMLNFEFLPFGPPCHKNQRRELRTKEMECEALSADKILRNTNEMLRISQENTKQNSNVMLRICNYMQSNFQRKC